MMYSIQLTVFLNNINWPILLVKGSSMKIILLEGFGPILIAPESTGTFYWFSTPADTPPVLSHHIIFDFSGI